MQRTTPEETKVTICVWHPFTEWRPKPGMAEAIRKRWPELRVVHLPSMRRPVSVKPFLSFLSSFFSLFLPFPDCSH
jgi:hypothetical protein